MNPSEHPVAGSGRTTRPLAHRRRAALCLTTALSLLIGTMPPLPVLTRPAHAQSENQDPPDRVGRLALIAGLASSRQNGDDNWTHVDTARAARDLSRSLYPDMTFADLPSEASSDIGQTCAK